MKFPKKLVKMKRKCLEILRLARNDQGIVLEEIETSVISLKRDLIIYLSYQFLDIGTLESVIFCHDLSLKQTISIVTYDKKNSK